MSYPITIGARSGKGYPLSGLDLFMMIYIISEDIFVLVARINKAKEDNEMIIVDGFDIVGYINSSCNDRFYRKKVYDFLKKKYFGNGDVANGFYRLYTASVNFIDCEEHEVDRTVHSFNRTITFKISKLEGEPVEIKRDDSLPFFKERVTKFMKVYMDELYGYCDKEIYYNTLRYLERLIRYFESMMISCLADKVSYNAMRVDAVMHHSGHMTLS